MNLEIKFMTTKEIKSFIEEGWINLIIVVGTLEPHGPHLPVGTDTIIPYELAKDIAESIKALIAPPIEYGVVNSLYGFAGATSVSEDTLRNMLVEIIKGFSDSGFEKFVILNGHGGNITPIRDAQRILWKEYGIPSLVIHWWIEAGDITKEIFGESGGHAGIDETAMILHKYPDHVRRIPLEDEVLYVTRGFDAYPIPGTILIYKPKEGVPRFDEDLARKFYEAVKKRVLDLVKRFIDYVDNLY